MLKPFLPRNLNEAMTIVYMAPIELKQIKLAFLLTVYATQIFVFLSFSGLSDDDYYYNYCD